jgi:hypothetical protein
MILSLNGTQGSFRGNPVSIETCSKSTLDSIAKFAGFYRKPLADRVTKTRAQLESYVKSLAPIQIRLSGSIDVLNRIKQAKRDDMRLAANNKQLDRCFKNQNNNLLCLMRHRDAIDSRKNVHRDMEHFLKARVSQCSNEICRVQRERDSNYLDLMSINNL